MVHPPDVGPLITALSTEAGASSSVLRRAQRSAMSREWILMQMWPFPSHLLETCALLLFTRFRDRCSGRGSPYFA